MNTLGHGKPLNTLSMPHPGSATSRIVLFSCRLTPQTEDSLHTLRGCSAARSRSSRPTTRTTAGRPALPPAPPTALPLTVSALAPAPAPTTAPTPGPVLLALLPPPACGRGAGVGSEAEEGPLTANGAAPSTLAMRAVLAAVGRAKRSAAPPTRAGSLSLLLLT